MDLWVMTGDTKLRPPRERKVSLDFDFLNGLLTVALDGDTAQLPLLGWPMLTAQVSTTTLHDWQYGQLGHPLGDQQMRNLTARIDSTATYQLFRAALDIACVLRCVDEPEHVGARFPALSGVLLGFSLTPYGKRGGLYFPPQSMVSRANPGAVRQLLLNNKICRLSVTDRSGSESSTLYVPSATPVVWSQQIDSAAQKLWDEIRQSNRRAREGVQR